MLSTQNEDEESLEAAPLVLIEEALVKAAMMPEAGCDLSRAAKSDANLFRVNKTYPRSKCEYRYFKWMCVVLSNMKLPFR